MMKLSTFGVKVASFGLVALAGVVGCATESSGDKTASNEESNVGVTSQAWEILDDTTCNNVFGSDTLAKYRAQKKANQILNYMRGSTVWPSSPLGASASCDTAKTVINDLRKFVAKDQGGGWTKAFTQDDTTLCGLKATMTRICKRKASCTYPGNSPALWPGQTTASDSADFSRANYFRDVIGQCFGTQVQAYFFPKAAYSYNSDCAVCLDVDPGPVKLTQTLATNGAAAGTYLDGKPIEDANWDGTIDTVLQWPAAYTYKVDGKTWGGRPCSTIALGVNDVTDQVLVRETDTLGNFTNYYSCRAAAGDNLTE